MPAAEGPAFRGCDNPLQKVASLVSVSPEHLKTGPFHLDADQARLFRHQVPINALTTIAVMAMATAILWPHVPHSGLLLWSGAQIALAGALLWRWYGRRHRPIDGAPSRRGSRRILISTALSGALWGSGIVFLPYLEASERLAVFLLLGGLAAGATATLAAIPAAARLYVMGCVLPMIFYFLGQYAFGPGDPTLFKLGVIAIGFMAAMMSTIHLVYRSIRAQIDARREQDASRREMSAILARFEQARQEWLDISSATDAFALFDADGRLLLWNDKWAAVLALETSLPRRGMRLEALLEKGAAPIEINGLPVRDDTWQRRILDLVEARSQLLLLRFPGDRWFEATARRQASGTIVLVLAEITERRRAEQSLRESEAQLARAQRVARLGSSEIDFSTGRCDWSDELYRLLGLAPQSQPACQDLLLSFVHADDRDKMEAVRSGLMTGELSGPEEFRIVAADGAERILRLTGEFVRDDTGAPLRAIITFQDITDLRKTEARLHQAQKMEAVGLLVGGLAHDFNNLLAIIIGNLELAEERLGDDTKTLGLVSRATGAAHRGAELTRRLLDFSRKESLRLETLDLNDMVNGMLTLLRRTIGQSIEVATRLEEAAWPVRIDRCQIENSLINLAINARDAMPEGGRLTISTRNLTLRPGEIEGLEAGDYVALEIMDTGCGIAPEHIDKVLEPFFTTKEVGKGTGLGLSMVRDLARSAGGELGIESTPGKGTTVALYLPRHASDTVGEQNPANRPADMPAGCERILVVEDDEDVRAFVVDCLSSLGYEVLEAGDGPAAMALLDDLGEAAADIDLLFTDIILPHGMNGREVAVKVRERVPTIKVLYTSGFTGDAITESDLNNSDFEVLTKPYRSAELAVRIRAALDRPAPPS